LSRCHCSAFEGNFPKAATPLIEVHDLKIDRLAAGITNRRQRQHALIRRSKNRIQQLY